MQDIRYQHIAQYYETDQMGIIHHSNYIRWMEEARIFFLEKIGFGYKQMEEDGILSPVLNVNCDYKKMVKFGDTIEIRVFVKAYNHIKLTLGYEMINLENQEICTVGTSTHCFLDREGNILPMKKKIPEFDQRLMDLVEK